MHRILIVDPEAARRERLAAGLRELGHETAAADCAEPQPRDAFDVVALAHDAFSPQAVATLKSIDAVLPVVVFAPRMPGESSLREMGAARVTHVVEASDAATLASRLGDPAARGSSRRRLRRVAHDIIGSSDAVQQVRRYVELAAGSDANVLVLGESGTGKELVARAVHRHGSRRDRPFIPVNCAAIPEALLESALFGHERGAFTGAVARTRGYLEQADGGTLFFDEIGDMPATLQAKLLRVLQPHGRDPATVRTFTRVGGEESLRTDVRMLFATHRDLEAAARAGTFREDLLQRIQVLLIRIPPLRERREDVKALAEVFLEQHAAAEGREGSWLDDAALAALRAHHWPRNVRELESVMRRVVVMKEQPGPILLGDLPADVFAHAPHEAPSPRVEVAPRLRPLEDVEREHVERVMAHVGGNKTKAAKILGLSRQGLDRRLRKTKPREHRPQPDA